MKVYLVLLLALLAIVPALAQYEEEDYEQLNDQPKDYRPKKETGKQTHISHVN